LIVSEVIPRGYSRETFIYEDSIILIERIDPTFYSSIKVRKLNDRQDHLFNVYFLPCDSVIVENQAVSVNTTFTSDANVLLLPQDAMFLVEDTQFTMNYAILNSAGGGTFIICSDMNSLTAFKHNLSIEGSMYFNASLTKKEVSTISYDFEMTGYYYIGFVPSGNITVYIDYRLNGYSYVRPSTPTCILREESDTCFVRVPETLKYQYERDYCLLGEVVSNPYVTDQVSIDIEYKVEHNGKWNFVTITFLALFSTLCIFNLIIILYWCTHYGRRKWCGK
jgi:hypothetical protein